ncbi:hypothetical protein QQ045_010940 [Rhodiola kirilowii]
MSCIREGVTQWEGLCVVSDRHAGILAAMREPEWRDPKAYHRVCGRQFQSNFMTKVKDEVLKAKLGDVAYAKKELMFRKKFGELLELLHDKPLARKWWREKGDGFEVKDTYNTILEHKEKVDWHKMVWNDFNAPRDSLHAWLVVQNKLMTRDRMNKWGAQGDDSCVLCDAAVESRDHLFFDCSFSQEVWKKVMKFLLVEPVGTQWNHLIPWFKRQQQTRLKTKFIAAAIARIMNGVWKARNFKIFREVTIPTDLLIHESIWYLRMKLGVIKRKACSIEDIKWLRLMKVIED